MEQRGFMCVPGNLLFFWNSFWALKVQNTCRLKIQYHGTRISIVICDINIFGTSPLYSYRLTRIRNCLVQLFWCRAVVPASALFNKEKCSLSLRRGSNVEISSVIKVRRLYQKKGFYWLGHLNSNQVQLIKSLAFEPGFAENNWLI